MLQEQQCSPMVVEKASPRCCIVHRRITRWVHGQSENAWAQTKTNCGCEKHSNWPGAASMMGEVPVGALVVFQGHRSWDGASILGKRPKSPLGHAEIMAIGRVSWRFRDVGVPWGATLYVTLEPRPMCAGAIVHARLPRVVLRCRRSTRTGACGSVLQSCST